MWDGGRRRSAGTPTQPCSSNMRSKRERSWTLIRLLKSSAYALIVLLELSALILRSKIGSMGGGGAQIARPVKHSDENDNWPWLHEAEWWEHNSSSAPRSAP